MLGHKLFKILGKNQNLEVYGTVRTSRPPAGLFTDQEIERIRPCVDADNFDTVIRSFASIQPGIVINCIGLIKQLPTASDPLSAITINSQLPHRISMVCRTAGARLIHISTDCVFDGVRGNYIEQDHSNATDLYGRTKFLGEVHYPPHCLTLRTSIIGHEFKGKLSLVEWFLAQKGTAKGFTKAVFSGLTTVEMARVLETHVIPNPSLTGLYHLSGSPVSKHDLISLIAKVYEKDIEIQQDSKTVIDRSLNSDRFRNATGYQPPSWPDMIEAMHGDFLQAAYYAREGH